MKVILMLKAPRPGTVKTRLAKDLGYERATEIYRKLVEHQIAQLPPEFDVEIYFAPVDAEQEMKGWLGNKFQFHPQSEGNLGDRLTASANEVFNNQTDGLIFLGGDCPHLTTEILMKCKRQMENHEVVIGPACDGGYCYCYHCSYSYHHDCCCYHDEYGYDYGYDSVYGCFHHSNDAHYTHMRACTMRGHIPPRKRTLSSSRTHRSVREGGLINII